jgi:hypothetical protein
MSEVRGWGSTVLGWFVVREDTETGSAPDGPSSSGLDEVGPDSASMSAPAPDPFQSPAPPAPGGQVDFNGVFDAAGIAAEQRERIARADSLLQSLPADTPLPARKQIVEASLRAFNVPIDRIIETGVEEIQALEAYIRTNAAETHRLLEESARRVEQYEQEIKNIRTVMDERVREQNAVTSACNTKKLEVQRVLEFFGQEAVARVVRESPRLVDPSASGASNA